MQPFTETTVLDFTQVIAGPLCTRMLADLGADVIKIEPPDGESFRTNLDGAYFSSYNTSKRSISIDLKSEEERSLVHEGVEEADVIVENFRPDVMEKFGLDYESVRAVNKDIIYCSVSGYGQTGPYSAYPAYDPIIQARSGLLNTIGYPDRPPVRLRTPLIDMGAGANAAFAIVTALWNRDRTGEGTHIDISLYETAVSWMSYWIAYYMETGQLPERRGRKGGDEFAPTSVCKVKDGEVYLIAPTDQMFETLCEAINRPDLYADERFSTRKQRADHHDELIEELERSFAAYEAAELTDLLSEAGVPVAPVQNVDDLVDDPHLSDREMLVSVPNRETGSETTIAKLPFQFSNMDVHETPPPELAADTETVLREWGYSEAEITAILEE